MRKIYSLKNAVDLNPIPLTKHIGKGQSTNSKILLTPNTDIVETACYRAIDTVAGNLSMGTGLGRYYLNINNLTRIRHAGTVHSVSFWLDSSATVLNSLYVQFMRKIGSTYTVIGEENITSGRTLGAINTAVLTTSISVQEGDMVCIGGDDEGAVGRSIFTGINVTTNPSFYYLERSSPPPTGINWEGQPSLGYILPVKVYMRAPLFSIIGDSIVAGHPAHYSFIENSNVRNLTSSISYNIQLLDSNITCQNMGIGSQTTTNIKNRFTTDIVNIKPRIVIINGGVNDLAGSPIKATFLSNYTTMLDACEAAGIIPVVMKIAPWTAGSNALMQTRDDWMIDLKALVESYQGAIFVDLDETLGQFRSGGDAGNLWNIKTAYNADGVHFNTAGYSAAATKILNDIKEVYRFS